MGHTSASCLISQEQDGATSKINHFQFNRTNMAFASLLNKSQVPLYQRMPSPGPSSLEIEGGSLSPETFVGRLEGRDHNRNTNPRP